MLKNVQLHKKYMIFSYDMVTYTLSVTILSLITIHTDRDTIIKDGVVTEWFIYSEYNEYY